jgi:glutaredoxin 3
MTVPQIFIGELHIGGFDDLAKLNRSGGLDKLLS